MQRAIESMTEDGRLGAGRLLRQQWPQLRPRLRQQWGKLTDEELEEIQGNPDALIGKLQEHYGRSRTEVEQELERWLERQQRQERQAA